MVLSALVRNDLRIFYEGWINSLNEENKENIEYCVEKTYLREACELFNYYFEKDKACEHAPNMDKITIDKTPKEIKTFSIVNCKKEKFYSNSQIISHESREHHYCYINNKMINTIYSRILQCNRMIC